MSIFYKLGKYTSPPTTEPHPTTTMTTSLNYSLSPCTVKIGDTATGSDGFFWQNNTIIIIFAFNIVPTIFAYCVISQILYR